jgi:hypothetical protein
MWASGFGHLRYKPTLPDTSLQAKLTIWSHLPHLIDPDVFAVTVFNDNFFVYSLGDYQCPLPTLRAKGSNCDAMRCDLQLELQISVAAC